MKSRSLASHLRKLLIVAGFAAMLPEASWAGDHGLQLTGALPGLGSNAWTVNTAGAGVFNQSGTFSTALTVNIGGTPTTFGKPFGPNDSFTVKITPVKMCKQSDPIHNGPYEWLDQGPAVVSVSGTLYANGSPATGAGWRLLLSETSFTNTYSTPGPCTAAQKGNLTYAAVTAAQAQVEGSGNNQGTYKNFGSAFSYEIWNTGRTVPLPSTLLLMLAALASGLFVRRKDNFKR